VSLPVDITTITVTGSYADGQGNPQSGSVMFTPSSELADITGKVVISRTPIVAPVGTGGTFSCILATTDNATLFPAGWAWNVQVSIPGAVQNFNTYLPGSVYGATVDMSVLSPGGSIPQVSGTYAVSVNGLSGSVSLPPLTSGALPAGALAETVSRALVTSSSMPMTSGQLYISQITLNAGNTTGHWNWLSGSSASSALTHWWGVLLNASRAVIAVTADQLAAEAEAGTLYALPWQGTGFITSYTGTYYWGIMLAGSTPTSAATGTAPGSSVAAALPFSGTSTASLTTPPAIGTVMAPAGTSGTVPYGYVS
jgi:hypothetical protein